MDILWYNNNKIPADCYNLINMHIINIEELHKIKKLTISDKITDVELDLIEKNCYNLEKIEIMDNMITLMNEESHIYKKLNKTFEISLNPKKLYDLNTLKEFVTNFPNSYIMYDYQDVSIQKFIYVNNKLDDMVDPIKNINLSPLEQFIYIFYITSHFRKFKDVKYNEDKSRNLFELFDEGNDQIVCGGFSKILEELGKRINIPILKTYTKVYTVSEEGIQYDCGHFRNIIRLKDDKYQIDGIFTSDPTWNNIMNKELYTMLLMTPFESLSIYNYRFGFGDNDMLSAQNYDEFIHIIHRDFKYNDCKYFNKTLSDLLYLCPELKQILNNTSAYETFIYNDHPTKKDYLSLINNNKFTKILFDFIYNICNNPVSGNSIINAASNVKKELNRHMSDQELEKYKHSLINQNYYDYELMFQPLIAYKSDNTITVLENMQNKFKPGPRNIK